MIFNVFSPDKIECLPLHQYDYTDPLVYEINRITNEFELKLSKMYNLNNIEKFSSNKSTNKINEFLFEEYKFEGITIAKIYVEYVGTSVNITINATQELITKMENI